MRDNGILKRPFERRGVIQLAAGTMTAGLALGATGASAKAGADSPTAGGAKGRKPIIIDGLGGISNVNLRILPEEKSGDPAVPDKGIDARALEDVKASGMSAVNVTIGYVAGEMEPFEHSVREVGQWDALIRRNNDRLAKVLTAQDIRDAHGSGKAGVILGFQNAAMMGDDASRVEIFANLGVRVIQLTYNVRNQIGDGSMVSENRGLTEFGREVVAQLNANNILVDLSHSGERTCLDALAASKVPIAITHTGCRAVTDLPRNKSDQELKLLADKGGVAGMYYMPFLATGRQALAADLVAHMEHAINVCGEDHVGIGSDGGVSAVDDMSAYRAMIRKEVAARRAAGIGAKGETADIVPMLPDLQGPDKYWKLADMLESRGHKAARIDKILGGNFLRLMDDVWTGV
ncbi:dipeptidase [Sphingorhabdus sp. M41]|uniref:dipeptidase n=1 Tax=Sphingorhabdus sp. M41 TaxID=1806885 RepID=UPI000AC3F156|nr:membrane dipeptidase [Sphingorhabdus sp. M41]